MRIMAESASGRDPRQWIVVLEALCHGVLQAMLALLKLALDVYTAPLF